MSNDLEKQRLRGMILKINRQLEPLHEEYRKAKSGIGITESVRIGSRIRELEDLKLIYETELSSMYKY